MTAEPRSDATSELDAMLGESRQQFDALYDGPDARPNPVATPPPVAEAVEAITDPARFLNDRHGDGWRREFSERRRDGNEAVVRCTLTIDDGAIVKSQLGRAPIASDGAPVALQGNADGIAFSVATEPGNAGVESEAAAFRAAERDALAKCVALL